MKSFSILTAGAVGVAAASHADESIGLAKRQQAPFSVIAATPDSRFYTLSGTQTQFIGTDTAALTTATVTSADGVTSTTAVQAATTTATSSDGNTEFNIVLAPALRDKVWETAQQQIQKRGELAELAERGDLEARGLLLAPVALAIGGALTPEFVLAFVGFAGISLLGTLAAVGIGMTVLAVDYAVGAVINVAAEAYASLAASWNAADGPLPPQVKVDMKQVKPLEECPKDLECFADACQRNDLFVCTTDENAGCPCKSECPADSDKGNWPSCVAPFCNGGVDKICTDGTFKDCPCLPFEDTHFETLSSDTLDKGLSLLETIFNSFYGHQAGTAVDCFLCDSVVNSQCVGGDFDGQDCCGDPSPGLCEQNDCNGLDQVCTNRFKGCACLGGAITGTAPQCSQCGSGGSKDGKCQGGTFDQQYCCGDTPGNCDENDCNGGNDGICTNKFKGCSCTVRKFGPTDPNGGGPNFDCNNDCCGSIPDSDFCIQNCQSFFNNPCGMCLCNS